jgi:serine protease AprX
VVVLGGISSRRTGPGRRAPRPLVLAATLLAALSAGLAARVETAPAAAPNSYVAPSLLAAASQNPNAKLRVIVQSSRSSTDAERAVRTTGGLGDGGKLRRRLGIVHAVSLTIKARWLTKLADAPGLIVTPDTPARASDYSTTQLWPWESGNAFFWGAVDTARSASMPAIAVIDSGIDESRPDLAGRVVASVDLATSQPNAPGDGRGHGTFVAGIAAGAAPAYAGAAPGAKLVSVDVLDDNGMAWTSDVIAAADWVLHHKDEYGIRVANFSLTTSTPSSFTVDPLDRAVERLWFAGVVVVAAAGNDGEGAPGYVKHAPANDPFVITVGAADLAGTVWPSDDFAAPWSAYGYTYDGFRKPELGAPGRYMVGPVPENATLATERPASVVAPGYMQLSGTSFAAPVVSGAAAHVLALHPGYTPDQVKGALMMTARPTASSDWALGVGEVNAVRAATYPDPPNPNAALGAFVSAQAFDAGAWLAAVQGDASWNSASWNSASWNSAAWESAAWGSASWNSASWNSASWNSDAAADAASETAADGDALSGGYPLTDDAAAALASDPSLSPLTPLP